MDGKKLKSKVVEALRYQGYNVKDDVVEGKAQFSVSVGDERTGDGWQRKPTGRKRVRYWVLEWNEKWVSGVYYGHTINRVIKKDDTIESVANRIVSHILTELETINHRRKTREEKNNDLAYTAAAVAYCKKKGLALADLA